MSWVGSWFLLLPAVALIGGLIGACGIGGVLLVPALITVGGVALDQAIAAASFGFALPGLVALRPLMREPRSLEPAIPLLAAAFAGAAAGALAVPWLSADALMGGITLLVLLAGWRGLRATETPASAGSRLGVRALMVVGALVGLGSALTGTGGPVLLIPVLMLLRQPIVFSVMAGQAVQLPVAISGGAMHAIQGTLDLRLALGCGVLMLLGAVAGQRAATGLSLRQMQRLVSILLLAVGIWFLWVQKNAIPIGV